jgi:ABC-type sugar transport system ATPase subunit
VRAEYIHLDEDGAYAVIETVTPFFAERHQLLDVHLAGEHWQMQVPLDVPVEQGATIRCSIDPAGILFFDPKTGKRIG